MTPAQMDMVRLTFRQLQPFGDQLGRMFYQRLFALDPAMTLQLNDEPARAGRFADELGAAVGALNDRRQLTARLASFRREREQLGITGEHVASGREALQWLLEDAIGDDLTREAEQAWLEFYDLMTDRLGAGHWIKATLQ